MLYISAFFVTIATILGTGILVSEAEEQSALVYQAPGRLKLYQQLPRLYVCQELQHARKLSAQGLPVTLANSGIAPFAATFAVCLLMQVSQFPKWEFHQATRWPVAPVLRHCTTHAHRAAIHRLVDG